MRNPTFSVIKALAIILVVITHSGCPGWLSRFAFQFHVPAFFICAGYFFHAVTPKEEYTFLVRRFRGIYRPYVCWSLLFLCLHNLMFPIGLLSEQFGNAEGGVLHPYTWQAFCHRFFSIIFNMSGQDEFLAGSFWFFRAFFIAGILWLILFKALRMLAPLNNEKSAGWGVAIVALLLAFWKTCGGFNIVGIAQGGYRELMGLFFMAMGYLAARYNPLAALSGWKRRTAAAAACLLVLVLFAVYCPVSMSWKATLPEFFALPVSALAGFGLLWIASDALCKWEGAVRRLFVYIGDHTLPVFAFHLIAFKIVTLFVVAVYALPWQAMGSYPVVHGLTGAAAPYLFLVYTFVGVALPLYVQRSWRTYAAANGLDSRVLFNRAATLLVSVLAWVFRGIYLLFRGFVKGIVESWRAFRTFIEASSPKNE